MTRDVRRMGGNKWVGALLGDLLHLAATDPKLAPHGALTSMFYAGAGCFLRPAVLYLAIRALA